MPFNGPVCRDLDAFKKSMASIPTEHKGAFDGATKESAQAVCDPAALHVWETDSDLDNLLQLTQVIIKVKSTTTDVAQQAGAAKKMPMGMVIVTEVSPGRDNFTRICDLVEHLTKGDGKGHLGGKVMAFGPICVVKSVNNSLAPDVSGKYTGGAQLEAEAAVKRISVTIERAFKMSSAGSPSNGASRKLVWHHGPVIHFLLHFISNTSTALRNSLTAVTIHSAIAFNSGIKPTTYGRQNKPQDMDRLEKYMKRLDIFAVFLDCGSQLISYDNPAVYVYYFAWYAHLLLPASVLRAHLHLGQDQLTTFAFQLRCACDKRYGASAVKLVREKLNGKTARKWANRCINADTFTKEKCRAAANDYEIHNAVKVADAPFALFRKSLPLDSEEGSFPAFSQLFIGPAAGALATENYVCAPVSMNLRAGQFKASSSSPFRLYIPKEGEDTSKVTARIQGTFMAVIECLRKATGGDPALGEEEQKMWSDVKKAAVWALDGCGLRLPKGVSEKVRHVEDRLGSGMWTWLLGQTAAQQGQGQAARAEGG
ncbi:hypothetical protein BDV96DRAFT_483686 [Lophiotrema nucula]|uniref:Uncharacterized protein n=1 Tax=Lophiotrema nucula TaxID=690887 RepID=A0A6A5ZQJ3_9PLEO|nr:hypothetical protein BDV96DRAFT_483686 [Lophiotrema nucula]